MRRRTAASITSTVVLPTQNVTWSVRSARPVTHTYRYWRRSPPCPTTVRCEEIERRQCKMKRPVTVMTGFPLFLNQICSGNLLLGLCVFWQLSVQTRNRRVPPWPRAARWPTARTAAVRCLTWVFTRTLRKPVRPHSGEMLTFLHCSWEDNVYFYR